MQWSDVAVGSKPERREVGSDRVGHVIGRKMRIVALGHPGVGVTELGRDDLHGDAAHCQCATVGVSENMEAGRRHDAGAAAALNHRADLVRHAPRPAVVMREHQCRARPPGREVPE